MRQILRSFGQVFALALALLPLAAAVEAQTTAPAWQSFGSSADGFKALFPSEPEVTKNSVPVGSASYELHSYVSTSGQTALYVGVCDYGPKGASAEPDSLLTSAKNGAVAHMNAHLLTEKKVMLDSNHGVEFEAESDKLHFTARMYVAGGVLYQAMVAAPINEKYADTARFLDSFQLVARPQTEAATAPAAKTDDWKPHPYPSDGFSASFPSEPSLEKRNISTDAGTFEFRTYSTEDSSAALIAAVCDYGSSAAGKDPEVLLNSAKMGAVNNIKGHLGSEKKITLGTNHGIEFQADNDSAHITARIYMAGSTLYQMIVVSPANSNYAETTRFLDSFQLIDRGGK
jgi:hypothetical protein